MPHRWPSSPPLIKLPPLTTTRVCGALGPREERRPDCQGSSCDAAPSTRSLGSGSILLQSLDKEADLVAKQGHSRIQWLKEFRHLFYSHLTVLEKMVQGEMLSFNIFVDFSNPTTTVRTCNSPITPRTPWCYSFVITPP